MSKATKAKGAGKTSGSKDGNVTIDLGEVVEKKLREAGMRAEVGKSAAASKGSAKPSTFGSFTPGMFGGNRPWFMRFGRPWLGQEAAAVAERRFTLIPASMQQVKTGEVLTGLGLGILGNRSLVRLTPYLWPNDSKLLHEGLAFVVGLIPMLFKRNGTTLGGAAVGAVMFGGALVDKLLTAIFGPPAVVLKGGMAEAQPRGAEVLAARQKLAVIQQRINLAQPQQGAQIPRVVARPQYA